jgi:hypothetical protein
MILYREFFGYVTSRCSRAFRSLASLRAPSLFHGLSHTAPQWTTADLKPTTDTPYLRVNARGPIHPHLRSIPHRSIPPEFLKPFRPRDPTTCIFRPRRHPQVRTVNMESQRRATEWKSGRCRSGLLSRSERGKRAQVIWIMVRECCAEEE